MVVIWIWSIGALLLLSIALTVFDAVGNRMSNEAIWLYTIISLFWPICLLGGLGYTQYNSFKARRLFRRMYQC